MAGKPEQLTLLDFIDWCTRNIDTDKLAALMTDYGYNRYDSETIAEAINDPDFYNDFGLLLRSSLNEDKSYAEITRASGEITANDWLKLSQSAGTFAKATGDTASTAPNTWAIIGGILGGLGTAMGSLFGNKETVTPAATATTTTTGSTTFLWIILAVVVLAVIVILVLSTSRKK